MPQFRHGRGTHVFVDRYELTTFLREASAPRSVDVAETSAFGTFDKTFVVGMREGRFSAAGMFDGTPAAVDPVLAGILGQEAAVSVTYAPEDMTIGRRALVLEAEESSYEVSSPINDVVAIGTEFMASGGIHPGVILHGVTAGETATGQSASVDNAAASTFGAIANLHMIANDRNAGSIVVKVQHSTDNSVWNDLITFTSVNFATLAAQTLAVAGTVNRYTRAQWTVTSGATGSYTFAVAASRKNV